MCGIDDNKYTVSQFCCGCTLRTGALVIGIIYVVGYLLQALTFLSYAINGGPVNVWYSFIIYLVQFIAACMLIHGVRMDRSDLVKVFVWTTCVLVVLKLIDVIILAINLMFVPMISPILSVIFDIYCIVVVRSYAIELAGGVATSPA